METLNYYGSLTVLTCWCGTRHAVPTELRNHQLRQHNDGRHVDDIYCPLGHTHVPSGESEAAKERRRREQAEARNQHLADQLGAAERSKSALKGQVTKIKKRVGKGVCPCCNRSFSNVERHMHSQHPEFADSVVE